MIQIRALNRDPRVINASDLSTNKHTSTEASSAGRARFSVGCITIFIAGYLYSRSMTLSHWNSLGSEFITQSRMLLSVMEKYSTITVSLLVHKESKFQI